MSTIRFELRKDKADMDGKMPIRIIYQISGQRKTFPTNLKSYLYNWNGVKQKAVYLDRKAIIALDKDPRNTPTLAQSEISEMNAKLYRLFEEIKDLETHFKFQKKTFTPDMIVEALRKRNQPESKRSDPSSHIVDFIDLFIKETTEHKPGTLKEYRTLANHMRAYEKSKSTMFTFDGDAAMLNGFANYLTKTRDVNNITKAKLITTFKAVLRHAKRTPYKIQCNIDYFDVKVKRNDSELEVIALTEEELTAIWNLDLSNNRALDEARDIFCFSCSTSLRYKDLRQLEWKHIHREGMIIIPSSNKNSKRLEIPLSPISQAIMDKYNGRLRPLPTPPGKQTIISGQKLGKHIKEIGRLAGIDTPIEIVRSYGHEQRVIGVFPKHELLSIHVGRKTFMTISLSKGMALHEAMSISSHSSYNVAKRYVNVFPERKKTVMKSVWGDFIDNKLKAV